MLYFNPGCALSLYRPEAETAILTWLRERVDPDVAAHNICCRHEPGLPEGSTIINVCAGCHRRFSTLYPGIETVSLWEVIDRTGGFPFPDYGGAAMSLHDPCPVRGNPEVHAAVRALLHKMNITLIETARHSGQSVCCGDDFYPNRPIPEVHRMMRLRAESMPCADVVVYCVSCIKAMHIGGRRPRHLTDLLFGLSTEPRVYDTEAWHGLLEGYIETH